MPSLGDTGVGHYHLHKHTISPDNTYYRLWQNLLAMLVIYSTWIAFFELAFIRYLPRTFFIVDIIVDLFFLVDVGVNFFVPYMDKSKFIFLDNFSRIAMRYLWTWLILDVASSIPYQVFALAITKQFGRGFLYQILNMLRLLRFRRFYAFFSRLEKNRHINYFWIRCLKLIVITILLLHGVACGYYLLAEIHPNPEKTWIGNVIDDFKHESIWNRYLYAMFWSMITFAALGYGNFHSVNTMEMVYNSLCMLFELGLNAYLIGNISDLIVDLTRRTKQFRDSVGAVWKFSIQNRLPSELRDQMMDYMSLKFKTERLEQEETLSLLPKALCTSVTQHLFLPTLENAYLFAGTSKEFLLQLVAQTRAEYFPPGEDIILHHEAPTEFYVIVSGKVEIFMCKDAREQHYGTVGEGGIIGEIGALCCKPQPLSAKSKTLCQLLRINCSTFRDVIQGNPIDGQILIYNLHEFLDQSDDLSTLLWKEIESLMSNSTIGVRLNMCFVTMKGDCKLIEQLLKRGRDPNEIDSFARTSLHIAAANGMLDCVNSLFLYGANPNIEDENGNVPLWEAIRGRHKFVAETLWEAGARLPSTQSGSLLCKAADLGSIDIVKDLLKYGCDINSENRDGNTILDIAITTGNLELISFLVEQGAAIDTHDAKGSTSSDISKDLLNEDLFYYKSEENKKSKNKENIEKNTSTIRTSQTLDIDQVKLSSLEKEFEESKTNLCSKHSFGERVSSTQTIQRTFLKSKDHLCKRVALYPYHPKTKHPVKELGRLVVLPESIGKLLNLASNEFNYHPVAILDIHMGEITDINIVRDGDHLYIVDQEQLHQLLDQACRDANSQ
ncbi:hypothetical protein KP509_38G020400 [Ceratopteris richardii]|nr:hypothetical protein KP509_38G020400 [Ceratopteris richardii]